MEFQTECECIGDGNFSDYRGRNHFDFHRQSATQAPRWRGRWRRSLRRTSTQGASYQLKGFPPSTFHLKDIIITNVIILILIIIIIKKNTIHRRPGAVTAGATVLGPTSIVFSVLAFAYSSYSGSSSC